ncbi:C4-dicarboxylate ABC transporter [Amycolatopsis albispora]|uniref:C4-dicarboxylate ABC transporter n=1 Tax=Amycolatopsis albispora TaxID=1804986 RepID=A0A344LM10_9PSEU|nr:C4-dicarboxylate ABC transporter [Amycolatopsis albispora]
MTRPAPVVCAPAFGPNWFASIMGTGIVATAAATLPLQFPGLRTAATLVWAVAAVLLVVVCGVALARLRRSYADDPVMAQFWGAPPMALCTVGSGALLLGKDWIGLDAALAIDWTLWTIGTAFGLGTAIWVPVKMMTTQQVRAAHTFAGWLMPVVPPMVSASGGALLAPHLPPDLRPAMVVGCYAMFGVSLFATLCLLPQIWQQLVLGRADNVPTSWIVLGPLGQSITAANLLAGPAAEALPAPYGQAAVAFGLLYGVPTLGFALVWSAIAASLTLRAARRGLPFTLSWWSFTFPVGTVVTGASALFTRVHTGLFAVVAVAGYAALVTAWLTVAPKTLRFARRQATT